MHDRFNSNISTPFSQGSAVAATVVTADKLNQESNTPLPFSEQFKLLGDRTMKISHDGDLKLVVTSGDQSKTFHVCSRQMRSASPVWNKMLDPKSNFTTIRDGNLDLDDDNLEALLNILLACHHKYHHVPQSIGLDTLTAICVVADKYDCIDELWPWIYDWVNKVYSSTVLYGPQWPFIAWVVGDIDKFKAVTAHLVSVCATNDSGQCLSRSGDVLDDLLLPDLPGKYIPSTFSTQSFVPFIFISSNVRFMTSCILETRASIITTLVEACHSLVKKYENAQEDNPVCKSEMRYYECDLIIRGILMDKLKKIGLWPGDLQEIGRKLQARNIQQISAELRGIKSFRGSNDSTSRPNKFHTSCGYDSAIDRIIDDANSRARRGIVILDSHRRHMETQRAKLQPTEPSLSSLED